MHAEEVRAHASAQCATTCTQGACPSGAASRPIFCPPGLFGMAGSVLQRANGVTNGVDLNGRRSMLTQLISLQKRRGHAHSQCHIGSSRVADRVAPSRALHCSYNPCNRVWACADGRCPRSQVSSERKSGLRSRETRRTTLASSRDATAGPTSATRSTMHGTGHGTRNSGHLR